MKILILAVVCASRAKGDHSSLTLVLKCNKIVGDEQRYLCISAKTCFNIFIDLLSVCHFLRSFLSANLSGHVWNIRKYDVQSKSCNSSTTI